MLSLAILDIKTAKETSAYAAQLHSKVLYQQMHKTYLNVDRKMNTGVCVLLVDSRENYTLVVE